MTAKTNPVRCITCYELQTLGTGLTYVAGTYHVVHGRVRDFVARNYPNHKVCIRRDKMLADLFEVTVFRHKHEKPKAERKRAA